MATKTVGGKKQQRLMKFSDFVARTSGKDRASVLAEEAEAVISKSKKEGGYDRK